MGGAFIRAVPKQEPEPRGTMTENRCDVSYAQARFSAQGVSKDKKVIAYCSGGISATVDLFVLQQLGYDDLTLYDDSMGEWARDPSLTIETD